MHIVIFSAFVSVLMNVRPWQKLGYSSKSVFAAVKRGTCKEPQYALPILAILIAM